jgi:voltage-gated potassium channel Kch
MGRTYDEIAYYLLSSVKRVTDDSALDFRLVKSWIRTSRAVWVKNELNKYKPISPTFIQSLGILALEVVDISEAGIATGFNVLKTVKQIPNTIETMYEPTITRIGPGVYTNAAYNLIPYERVPYIGHSRFSIDAIFAFMKDGYIYIISRGDNILKSAMRKIYVNAVLENPPEAANFTLANGTKCYLGDNVSMYPITEYLIAYMKETIVTVDLKLYDSVKTDDINNKHDDIISNFASPAKRQPATREQQQEGSEE